MFRIKAMMLAVLLMLLPAACAESASLISEGMMKDEAAHYKTVKAQIGTFERPVSTSAEEYYPVNCEVRNTGSKTRFAQYRVERNDEVKKGDVLAEFQADFDEAAYAGAKLTLERLEAELLRAQEQAGEEIEELEAELLSAASSGEKALARLRIERTELLREQSADQLKRQITAVRKQIAEMEEERDNAVLIAPMDGVVTRMESKRAGEEVAYGEALLTICREDIMLLAIENPAGAFRYGAELTIEVGSAKERKQLSGRVVAVDTMAPAAERKGYALAEIYNPDGVKLTRMTAEEAMMRVENVLLVPRRTVDMDGGKYYVMLLENGVPQKRLINCVYSNTAQDVWVLQGLEDGDEIIVD